MYICYCSKAGHLIDRNVYRFKIRVAVRVTDVGVCMPTYACHNFSTVPTLPSSNFYLCVPPML